jgi:hypothetical protein
MTDRPAPFAWLDVLGRVGAVSAVIAAWLTLAGWAFAYTYFAGFGIGISGLGLDLETLPLWGFEALRARWWQVLGGLAAVLTAFAALSASVAGARMLLVVLLPAVALAFLAAVWTGRQKALDDLHFFRENDWPGFVRAIVHLDPGVSGGDATLAAMAGDLADGCHRMLYANATHLYLIRPLAGRAGLGMATTVVPRRHVAFLRLGPNGLPPCRR